MGERLEGEEGVREGRRRGEGGDDRWRGEEGGVGKREGRRREEEMGGGGVERRGGGKGEEGRGEAEVNGGGGGGGGLQHPKHPLWLRACAVQQYDENADRHHAAVICVN